MNNLFLLEWPWLAIILGTLGTVSLSILLFSRPSPKKQNILYWLPLPIYMLHQFEEHGIDLFGQHYAFQDFACHLVSPLTDLAHCPATPAFIFGANVGTIWISGLLGGLFGSKHPLLGTGLLGIITVNAFVHIAVMIKIGHYNPGVATSLALFLPFSIIAYRVLLQEKVFARRDVFLSLLIGVGIHVVLLGSLISFKQNWISESSLVIIQVLNSFLPLLAIFAKPHKAPAVT